MHFQLINSSCLLAILLSMFIFPLTGNAQSKLISASPALLSWLKIETIKPQQTNDILQLSARVELDQHRVARIGASVTGRITEITGELGQTVKKGQRLAQVNSTELGQAQSNYLKASSQVNLHRLAVQRAERLLQSDVISSAELQERESMLNEAEVDMKAASDQLRVMGMQEADLKRLAKERNIHSYSGVFANIDGVVIGRNIAIGQVVQPADNLYTVADLSQLWLVAEVPEQHAQFARTGIQVNAEVAALPDHVLTGKLQYVSDLVNSETRTLTVRMALANPDRMFKPQMLASLKISKPQTNLLVVPSQAIVRDENQHYVFVQTAANRFELRAVKLGREENGKYVVLSGLKIDEAIVSDGAYHLNNERLLSNLE